MTIKELECFEVVCREKSITKAAKYLYITPQGLSKTIRNLEHELKTKLFDRSTSGITLTETGQYLYDNLPDFLARYYTIYRGIQQIDQQINHEIDLLSAYGILRLVTPECLSAFRKEHPEITLHYREYPDKQVERLFRAQEGNVAFSIGPASFSEFNAIELESFEIKLLVNRQHPLSRKKSVTIDDIKNEPLYIESSEFQINHLIRQKCKDAGFEPNIVFETSGFSLCHKLVRQNKGISVTVDFVFDDMSNEYITAIPFADGGYKWTTYMLTRKDAGENPDLQIFKNHILKWMDKIKNGEIKR